MNSILFIFPLIFAVFLAGCAHPMKERAFDPALCEEGLAYQAGFNDGRDGNNMNAGFTYGCREDLRAPSLKGYKEGFEKGHADFLIQQQEQRKMMAQMERDRFNAEARERATLSRDSGYTSGPGGGFGGGMVGGGASVRWFCETEPFTDRFEGVGATEFDARRNTKLQCESKLGRGSIHCDSATCRGETASFNQRAWLCTLNDFSLNYEGFGPTRFDAEKSVRASCREKSSDFSCKTNVDCKKLR